MRKRTFVGLQDTSVTFDFGFWKRLVLILGLFRTGHITFVVKDAKVFRWEESK